MKLFSRKLGTGPPVVILHGLFGMSDNWLTIGKAIADKGYSVHIPDLRNHGKSPHTESHRYPEICHDIYLYAQQEHLDSFHLIGHSMGGKAAMMFALLYPEYLDKLVVVDISPSDYRHPDNTFHSELIDILGGIDLTLHRNRSTIRKELEDKTADHALSMFLVKNIERTEPGTSFTWKLNLPVLKKFIQHLQIGFEELDLYAPSAVQTLFLKGNDSNYYLSRNDPDRVYFFPESTVIGIDNAGHWLHSEKPEVFLSHVFDFFE